MVYCGDAKHEQASSLSHERVRPSPEGPKEKKKLTMMTVLPNAYLLLWFLEARIPGDHWQPGFER